jgi:hypothetical protein
MPLWKLCVNAQVVELMQKSNGVDGEFFFLLVK